MAGKDAPNLAGVFELRMSNLQLFQRNSLAVEHPEDVMIGLHEQLCRVGEWLVPGKPACLRMPVRADDGQASDLRVQSFGNLSCCRVGGKKAIFVEQHGLFYALPGESRKLT